MALSNAFSPQFPGSVTAQSFQTTLVPTAAGTYTSSAGLRYIPQTIKVYTNGTNEVNVFGTTNPVSGTFLGAKIVARDDANGTITLQHTLAGTTVFSIAKGSDSGIKGTSLFMGAAFAAGATATVKSSSTGNAIVEIDFIVTNPALPGAQ